MSSLAAARADNFYYPPDFDGNKHGSLNGVIVARDQPACSGKGTNARHAPRRSVLYMQWRMRCAFAPLHVTTGCWMHGWVDRVCRPAWTGIPQHVQSPGAHLCPTLEPYPARCLQYHGTHALRERAKKLDQGILVIRCGRLC